MTAPIASKIILPTDTLNAGPKVQTQTEVVGADTVHAHFFIPRSRRKILGVYSAMPTVSSVQATAQSLTGTAFWWLQLVAAATVRARLRRLALQFTIAGEADMQSVPRIALARFTFTGAASGASVAPAKRKTSDATAVAILRTAVTGMTPVGDGHVAGFLVPTFGITTSGASWNAGPSVEWAPHDEEEFIDIGPGEGIGLYQPDNGTATDTRRFLSSIEWDEYDAA